MPPTEDWGDFSTYDVLPRGNVLDVPLYDDGNIRPALVEGGPGALLVFDIRLLHGGRVLDPNTPSFTVIWRTLKTQVVIVYGLDNIHS